MMKLYQNQHSFYYGIDLHANAMYVCVVDAEGKKLLHRNFHTRDTDTFQREIAPFGRWAGQLVVGCESTFNWYWHCDWCEAAKIPFVLGHALYLKAIHGGKVKNDKLDSEKLAFLLRGGNFPVAYAYPAAWRATRDLLRRRMHLVRRRSETLTSSGLSASSSRCSNANPPSESLVRTDREEARTGPGQLAALGPTRTGRLLHAPPPRHLRP